MPSLQFPENHKNSLESASHSRTLPIFNVWISSYCLLAAAKSAAGLRNLVFCRSTALCAWPKGEKLIAEAIGVRAEIIWPSRYSETKYL
ncbi:helix-turn-helix domain-containing protein [Rahnella sp. PCH160]|uniref:helix-turn-helix domain-containing protein n=1 Tax=Rahnella sp. PCH160 TaxID=3447928 RepID=UPI0039FD5FF2